MKRSMMPCWSGLHLCVFNNMGISPFLSFFFPKLRWYSQRSYNLKNHPIRTNSQTPRGFELYEFNCIVNKINKTIGLLCKFQNFLPRKALLTIYINPLSDHTLIMVTLFPTKLIIPLSIKNWNHFNTIPQNVVQFVVLQKKKFIMN